MGLVSIHFPLSNIDVHFIFFLSFVFFLLVGRRDGGGDDEVQGFLGFTCSPHFFFNGLFILVESAII